jgi:hypothetical protein
LDLLISNKSLRKDKDMNSSPDSTPTPRPTIPFPMNPDDARIARRIDDAPADDDDYAAALARAARTLPTPF